MKHRQNVTLHLQVSSQECFEKSILSHFINGSSHPDCTRPHPIWSQDRSKDGRPCQLQPWHPYQPFLTSKPTPLSTNPQRSTVMAWKSVINHHCSPWLKSYWTLISEWGEVRLGGLGWLVTLQAKKRPAHTQHRTTVQLPLRRSRLWAFQPLLSPSFDGTSAEVSSDDQIWITRIVWEICWGIFIVVFNLAKLQ